MRKISGAGGWLVLAMLLAPALPVLSEGGGDYPPPASGDWVITQDTWVENETVYLGGNLAVAGANLTFDNVSLLGNLTDALQIITIAEGASLSARNCWFGVGIASNLSFELLGKTDIRECAFNKSSGTVWVRLASASAVFSGCRLQGTLSIADGLSPVVNGTTVSDSEVGVYIGAGVRLAGLTVLSCKMGAIGDADMALSDCTFKNSDFLDAGIGLVPGKNASIEKCIFENIYEGADCDGFEYLPAPSNVMFSGCEFLDCAIAVVSGPDTRIVSCAFESYLGVASFEFRGRIEHSTFARPSIDTFSVLGIDITDDTSIDVGNCTFLDMNQSIRLGYRATASVKDCSFVGDKNRTLSIFSGQLSVRNCTFIPNASAACSIGLGSERERYRPELEIVDCTFQDAPRALRLYSLGNNTISRCLFTMTGTSNDTQDTSLLLNGNTTIRDTRIQSQSGTQINVSVGICRALNLSFLHDLVHVEPGASFEAGWYLDTTALYPSGIPADKAVLRVSDNHGNLLSTLSTDPDGRTPRQEITEYIREWNRTTYFTPISLNASKDGLARNLSVNLNQNLDLTLTLADVTAPSVRFTSPVNDTLLNRTTCVFSGAASDDQGVSSVRLRAGSGDWVVANGTTDWNATLDLFEGENRIIAEASDSEGNTATALLTVRVDTLPPVVEITYPAQDLLVNTTAIELTGRAEPGCTVLVDGETAPFYMGRFSAVVNLQEGPNEIWVTARDAAGNFGAASVNVTRDTIPPALTLTSPRNGEVTNQSRAAVSGTAEPGARVVVNGADAIRSGPFFSTEVVLVEGVNSITVQARDAAGNQASTTIRVILDRGAPFIAVSLQNGTITQSSTIRITGKTKPGASLSINGVPAEVAPDGNFSADVALKLGLNQIHIEARDLVGNTAALDRSITWEENDRTPPPKISEPARGISPALILGMAVGALIVLVILFIFLRSRPPPPTDSDYNKSGFRPEGRGP